MRARARATARASRAYRNDGEEALGADGRGRHVQRPVLPPAIDIIDETQARAACKPMGELEYVIQAADHRGRLRALYVIVPDLTLKPHYERLGFCVEPGCRVLLDAAALRPIAVLRIAPRSGSHEPPAKVDAAIGFNPYFDFPSA